MSLSTYNLMPNFSIVLPGKCNAKCKFCFWKEKSEDPEFLKNLKKVLLNKSKIFRQVSITGGEPCLSDQLVPVLKLLDQLKKAGHLDKIVLTTNGTGLLYKLSRHKCMKVINHINISRHSPDHAENLKIFNCDFIPDDIEIQEAIQIANMMGIDATLNCVIEKTTPSITIAEMIRYAKKLGASHVSFRKQYGNTLDETPAEKSFSEYASIAEGCPICRTKWQIIDGMLINWKASVTEPINAPSFKKGQMIYEAIFNSDGELTADWMGKNPIIFKSGLIFEGTVKESVADAEITKIYDRMYKAPVKIQKVNDPVRPSIGSFSGGCGSTYRGCGGGGCGS